MNPSKPAHSIEFGPSLQADSGPPEIEALVRSHYATIRRVCLSILDDPHEADDAAQETFIAAYRALENFRNQAAPRTWLTAISINVCRGKLRKRKRQEALRSALQVMQSLGRKPSASSEAAVLQDEHYRQLWDAVDNLDEKHRLPILLHYVHELSVPEIADILGASPGTVYSRLHYARRRIRERLNL
jgi:RNA polymerase sigma-70 factor (ECF subfamily)